MNPISEIHQEVFDFLIKLRPSEKDFFFILRDINRNARLEKGYWFLGNDNYLAISFWVGKDDASKSPRVSFVINKDGTTFLEIISSGTKHSYFSDNFFFNLGITDHTYNNRSKKYYDEFKTDYLKSLKNFLQNDKIIIDNYVKTKLIDRTDILASGGIDFIWPSNFSKQLNNIYKYQKIRKERLRKTGYLRNFHIKKFGKIQNLAIKNIPTDCRWIFITGENGAGKTSILRALASAITNNNDNGHKVAKGYDDFKVQVGLQSIEGVDKFTVKGSDEFFRKKTFVKGFASYGPVRLLTEGSTVEELFKFDVYRISKSQTYGLFNPIGILRDISANLVFNIKPKYHDMVFEDFLYTIEQNLELILPNIHKVIVESTDNGRFIKYQQSTNPEDKVGFDDLPSGTKNFAALILDLLIRFAEQQSEVTDISDYVGIVLIDEIDLHLHPKMQKEIIVQLSATFPNIQFVVTTHSPIPMLGAPNNSVFINVYKNSENEIKAEKLDIDITNLLPNTILTSPIFNFDELINNNYSAKERLTTEDDYSEALFYKILKKKIQDGSIKKLNNDSFTS